MAIALLEKTLRFTESDQPLERNVIVTELSEEAQLKLEVIESLLEPCDRTTYGQKLKEAAEKCDFTHNFAATGTITLPPTTL